MDELEHWTLNAACDCVVLCAMYSCIYRFMWYGCELAETFIAGLCTGLAISVTKCYCRTRIANWFEWRQNVNTESRQPIGVQQDSPSNSEHSARPKGPTDSIVSKTRNEQLEGQDMNTKTRKLSTSLSESNPVHISQISSSIPSGPLASHDSQTETEHPQSTRTQNDDPLQLPNTYSEIQKHSFSYLSEARKLAEVTSGATAVLHFGESQQSQRHTDELDGYQEMESVSPKPEHVLDMLQSVKEIQSLTNEFKFLSDRLQETSTEIVVLNENLKVVVENIATFKDAIGQFKACQITEVSVNPEFSTQQSISEEKKLDMNKEQCIERRSVSTQTRTSGESIDASHEMSTKISESNSNRLGNNSEYASESEAKFRTLPAVPLSTCTDQYKRVSIWRRFRNAVRRSRLRYTQPHLNANRNAFVRLSED